VGDGLCETGVAGVAEVAGVVAWTGAAEVVGVVAGVVAGVLSAQPASEPINITLTVRASSIIHLVLMNPPGMIFLNDTIELSIFPTWPLETRNSLKNKNSVPYNQETLL
jgi:hypothetical protein